MEPAGTPVSSYFVHLRVIFLGLVSAVAHGKLFSFRETTAFSKNHRDILLSSAAVETPMLTLSPSEFSLDASSPNSRASLLPTPLNTRLYLDAAIEESI